MKNQPFKQKDKLRRIRLLYAIFAIFLIGGLSLYFFNIFSEEPTPMRSADHHNSDVSLVITDIPSGKAHYNAPIDISNTTDGLHIHSHVSRYDVEIHSDTATYKNLDRSRTLWVMILQVVRGLCFIATLFLIVWFLISFYKNLKSGKAFPSKNCTMVSAIGILLIIMPLCGDISAFIERKLAYDLLCNTEWAPDVEFTIHLTRILTGLVIVFLAEIFRLGRDMQDEQELTI